MPKQRLTWWSFAKKPDKNLIIGLWYLKQSKLKSIANKYLDLYSQGRQISLREHILKYPPMRKDMFYSIKGTGLENLLCKDGIVNQAAVFYADVYKEIDGVRSWERFYYIDSEGGWQKYDYFYYNQTKSYRQDG